MSAPSNHVAIIAAAVLAFGLGGLSCADGPGEKMEGLGGRATTFPGTVTAPRRAPAATQPLGEEAVLGQTDTLLSLLNPESEFTHLTELASDGYQGRKTGSRGAAAAASYISSQYSSLGLAPWSEAGLSSYLHHFSLGGFEDDNVIGTIPGKSGDGFIILAAHYDHLGVDADGLVYNGADDNAAGVAALLEIARVIQNSGMKPEKTIVICAFSGEEQGQFGSQALGELIVAQGLGGQVEMFNIDGIGATGGDYLGVWDEGAASAAGLVSSLVKAGSHLGIPVREEGTDIGSDAQPFDWQFGIPAVTIDWHWGQDESLYHPYYHTVNDDPQHISLAALSRATRTTLCGLWLRASGY